MYEMFQEAALPVRERKQHIRLHNRIYGVLSRLDADRVDDFLDNDLREEIGGDLAEILGQYPLSEPELDVVYQLVEETHKAMRLDLETMWNDARLVTDCDQYILSNNKWLAGMIVDCVFPLLQPVKVVKDKLKLER